MVLMNGLNFITIDLNCMRERERFMALYRILICFKQAVAQG